MPLAVPQTWSSNPFGRLAPHYLNRGYPNNRGLHVSHPYARWYAQTEGIVSRQSIPSDRVSFRPSPKRSTALIGPSDPDMGSLYDLTQMQLWRMAQPRPWVTSRRTLRWCVYVLHHFRPAPDQAFIIKSVASPEEQENRDPDSGPSGYSSLSATTGDYPTQVNRVGHASLLGRFVLSFVQFFGIALDNHVSETQGEFGQVANDVRSPFRRLSFTPIDFSWRGQSIMCTPSLSSHQKEDADLLQVSTAYTHQIDTLFLTLPRPQPPNSVPWSPFSKVNMPSWARSLIPTWTRSR